MTKDTTGELRRFLLGFTHAGRGVLVAIQSQRNMRVHVAALLIAIGLGVMLKIAAWEWCVVILCSGLVLTAELINTAIEWLADRVTKEREEAIRDIKDAAAGAVLVGSIAAAAAGALIFVPKLLTW